MVTETTSNYVRCFVTSVRDAGGEPDIQKGINVLYCWLERKTDDLVMKRKEYDGITVFDLSYGYNGYAEQVGMPSALANLISKEEHQHRFTIEMWKTVDWYSDPNKVTIHHLINCCPSPEEGGRKRNSREFWDTVRTKFNPLYSENAIDYVREKKDRGFHVYCTYNNGVAMD